MTIRILATMAILLLPAIAHGQTVTLQAHHVLCALAKRNWFADGQRV